MKYRAHRYPTRFPVTVDIGGTGVRAVITSISSSGACLNMQPAPKTGQMLTLRHTNTRHVAKVKWATEDKAGIAFSPPLSKPALDRIRFGVNQIGGHTRPRKIGFAG
ncbi:PilZ domain-containing protein [Pseudooctadecabacter jejudonensis]|uniref:PilZ domain protein n=1 Tax=Pseudooctadecabacter jejudonensis TaxID=1391910 RepID=A0A1Y5T556_9RHOB|nr:PilZ domain-containing protein [Pseudooctadecabacter jejudonensis]SLN55511.1 PilZ domain protein [Pseudooctadecabacter jejudonensis]